MIAVSDASPLCYLVLIGQVELLPARFREVKVPGQVLQELRAEGAPEAVRSWANRMPPWISVHDAPAGREEGLERLQAGERAVILLAESLAGAIEDVVVLLDEKAARQIAAERSLQMTGLLGILVDAANRGLVDLPTAIELLTQTSFRYSPGLIKAVLDRGRL